MGNKQHPLLMVELEGPGIGPGRMAVSQLLCVLENFGKVLLRTGQVLAGENHSTRKGPKTKRLKESIDLQLVLLTHGSPTTVLGFDRGVQIDFPEMDDGEYILETSLQGLAVIQNPEYPLPAGVNRGVLLAWRELGLLFRKSCIRILFSLNNHEIPLQIEYTPAGFEQIQKRIRGPELKLRTVEGRLLMADFKEFGTRCRIHPPIGNPIMCLFEEDQKEDVLGNILQYVRIEGEAQEDPISGKITNIKIHDIERIEDMEADVNNIPTGEPLPFDFWKSWTIEELAEVQGVIPVTDVSVLLGTWPGEVDDGFEEFIQDLRRQNMIGENNP